MTPLNVGFLHLFQGKRFLIRENFDMRKIPDLAENQALSLILGVIFGLLKSSQIKEGLP